MRVLRLVLRVGPTSGPYNQLTLPALDRYENTLCTFFPSQFASEWTPDTRLEYVEGDGRTTSFVRHVRHLLRRRRFDVVHLHSPHLGPMLMAAGLPDWGHVMRRTVMTLHSSYSVYRKRNRCLLWPSFLSVAKLVCCGQAALASLPNWLRTAGGRRLTSIANGVDVSRIDQVRPPFLRNDSASDQPLRLISAGALRSLKNHLTVVRAMARVRRPNVRLTIIGGGTDYDRLQAEVARLDLSQRVQLTGQMSRDDALRHMWQADAFVSASRGEGLPIAVLEAMACHCPTILSDIPPHAEIAQRCDGAWLADGEDPNAIAKHIERLAAQPAHRRQALGDECRRRVEDQYSLHRMLDEYEVLYRSLAQS
jgi:glycosyltransferase involved in cell wall biosynthesis